MPSIVVIVLVLSVPVVVLLVVLLGHQVVLVSVVIKKFVDVHVTLLVTVLVVMLSVPMIASSRSSNLLVVVQLSLRAPKVPVTSINNPLVDMVVRLVLETFMVEPPPSWNCNFGTQGFKDKATKWKTNMESCIKHVKSIPTSIFPYSSPASQVYTPT